MTSQQNMTPEQFLLTYGGRLRGALMNHTRHMEKRMFEYASGQHDEKLRPEQIDIMARGARTAAHEAHEALAILETIAPLPEPSPEEMQAILNDWDTMFPDDRPAPDDQI